MTRARDNVGATWRIAIGAEETAAIWEPPASGPADRVFICAHGAGGHLGDKAIVAVTQAIRERGIGTVRFNFLYRARRSARPDPIPRLTACLTAVVEKVCAELAPSVLVLDGRSMGGRAASVLVSEGTECQGLLLLAYPLHPPGRPEKLRTSHLGAIRVPVLCLNGTRDPFCDRESMERTLDGLGANWRMRWLEGADHSFHVLESSGRTDADVLREAADEAATWWRGLE
jgi:hypothetical protein